MVFQVKHSLETYVRDIIREALGSCVAISAGTLTSSTPQHIQGLCVRTCVCKIPVSRNKELYFSWASWNRFAHVEMRERRQLCYFWSVGEHLSLAINEGDKQQFSF